ncbi:hypothetical protein QFC22_005530 [Naganishia vaughanmartiniae]|uniref:Uncharacterized protein n=1 Tax=Naganishia vaughanmartiniae TaxID=1424756 RepID=A0ACC2WSA1_9TREE|nr:hypothetical protein QFC22_005530 [Naganishia vaughanmartiniae]
MNARSAYVDLIRRSYLEAVREVNLVRTEAQAEARRQNGGVLPALFQLSPLHQEQIRVITSSFVNLFPFAETLGIEPPEIELIVQQIDELLSRNNRGPVAPRMALQPAAMPNPVPPQPPAVTNAVRRPDNGGRRSSVGESSNSKNLPALASQPQGSTTGINFQPSAPQNVNPVKIGGGINGTDTTLGMASNPHPVEPTAAPSPLQGSHQLTSNSVESVATTAADNSGGTVQKQTSIRNANGSNGSGEGVLRPSPSDSPGVEVRLLSSTADVLSSQTERRPVPTAPPLSRPTVLLQPQPSPFTLPPPSSLAKSPPNKTSPIVSPLPSAVPEPSSSNSGPQVTLPAVPLPLETNTNTARSTTAYSVSPWPVMKATASLHSTVLPSSPSSWSSTIPALSLTPMHQSTGHSIVPPQVHPQSVAQGTSPLPLALHSATPSASASPSVSKSYRHSKMGNTSIRRVTVGLNGMVTGRPSGSTQLSEKTAGKQPLRPTLSSFDSNSHAQAKNAARSRILQAQQHMLAQAISSLEQTAESATPRVVAATDETVINDTASYGPKPSRTIYDVSGGSPLTGVTGVAARLTNPTAAPLKRLTPAVGNANTQAQRSLHLSGTRESQASDRYQLIGSEGNTQEVIRNREIQAKTPSTTVSETATSSTPQDRSSQQPDTHNPTVASSTRQALLPFKPTSLLATGTKTAESVQGAAQSAEKAAAIGVGNRQSSPSKSAGQDLPAIRSTTIGAQRLRVSTSTQAPSLRLRKESLSASIPPLPEWLMGRSQRSPGESAISPLPAWAYDAKYDAPVAPYAIKRRRMHASPPAWYSNLTVPTTASHGSIPNPGDERSGTTTIVGASPSTPTAATVLRASTKAAETIGLQRHPLRIQRPRAGVQTPKVRSQRMAVPMVKGTKEAKRRKRVEEVVAMDIDTPLDLAPNVAVSPQESPCVSPDTPSSPASRPAASGVDSASSQGDEDITMSDGTDKEKGPGTSSRMSCPSRQLAARKQSASDEDEILPIATSGSPHAVTASSGAVSSSSPQRQDSTSPDPISYHPEAQQIIGAATRLTSLLSEEMTDEIAPVPYRWPNPAPPVIHAIPEEFTNKDITKWQRKVWRTCFCEWPGCGAVLNSWESYEKHILHDHVTHQRPRPNPNSDKPSIVRPAASTMSAFERAQLQNGRRPPKPNAAAWGLGDQPSRTDEDEDPIALNPGTNRTRANQIKLILKPPGSRNTFADYREPSEAQASRILSISDCYFLTSHPPPLSPAGKGLAAFYCPYTFSEAFPGIRQSHQHIRSHSPADLAHMQYAEDMRGIIPTSALVPLPEEEPTYLMMPPPVRNGPKAPPEALIHALADTQDSWDAQADMTFRTAFGFLPVAHSEPALEGSPIPPYDMYAQGTPSDTRSVFNPVPEYTLCTPRHPASHKSWKRLPVKMEIVPKTQHEKIVTPWCNLSELSRREDAKIKLIMTRDPEKAIQEQKKKGPRKVALEDPEEVPEGMEREWPTRETIGPWHYLEDMP